MKSDLSARLLYGAAYYQEYMPFERLTEDVRLMKETGINVSDRPAGFSTRLMGEIQPHYSEEYAFAFAVGGYSGARLWIGDTQVVDAWQKGKVLTRTIKLEAGKTYSIKAEYVSRNFFDAGVRLFWSSPSQFRQVIPKTQLYPTL